MVNLNIASRVSRMLSSMKEQYFSDSVVVKPELPQEKTVNRNPVFVYQMGRVGSTSITHSLHTAYQTLSMDIPIYHAHYMNNYEVLEARARRDLPDASLFIRDLQLAKELRRQLVESPDAPRLKIICLVRDIIVRNVSTFFFALAQFIPDWEQRLLHNSLTVGYLHEIFLSRHAYAETALNWFDEQVQPVFDIDVYATPFPAEEGYKIYTSSKADLLVMRLESLQGCVDRAIQEFLGLRNFKLVKINTGEERTTAELQRMFRGRPLPREYVKRMYASRLSRHFYTDHELNAFTRYWTQAAETE